MPYARTKSLLFGLATFAVVFALGQLLIPPELAARAQEVAPLPEESAGGVAGVLWDLFGTWGWKALFVLLIMGTVTGLYLGGGRVARRYGWPRAGALFESGEFRLASVFLLAFVWSVVKAGVSGVAWSRPVFVEASEFAAQAIAGHQIWKQVLRHRVVRLIGGETEGASAPLPPRPGLIPVGPGVWLRRKR